MNRAAPHGTGPMNSPAPDAQKNFGLRRAFIGAAVVAALFSPVLIALWRHSIDADLHSHVLLIPVFSAALLYMQRGELPGAGRPAALIAAGFLLLAAVALAAAFHFREGLSQNDWLALLTAAFVCSLWASCAIACGSGWMCAAAAPLAFLVFAIPLPDPAVATLEQLSTLASADASELLFQLFGIAYLRDGTVFRLPGIAIEVARECSGIRSSWVLFIASLFAGQMLLRNPVHRLLLLALVIPLGILRNAMRIVAISWLCIEWGPRMIHSDIHEHGGPIFFVLSLVPLLAAAWFFALRERHRGQQKD